MAWNALRMIASIELDRRSIRSSAAKSLNGSSLGTQVGACGVWPPFALARKCVYWHGNRQFLQSSAVGISSRPAVWYARNT